MATITPAVYVVQDTEVTFGDDDYSLTVLSAELVPTATDQSVTSVNGVTYSLSGKSAWVLNVTYPQDWETATSLSNFLFDHEGELVDFSIKPTATSQGFTGKCTLKAGNIGAASNTIAQSTASFPVTGKPTRVAA